MDQAEKLAEKELEELENCKTFVDYYVAHRKIKQARSAHYSKHLGMVLPSFEESEARIGNKLASQMPPIALLNYYTRGLSQDQRTAKREIIRRLANYQILLVETDNREEVV